MRGKMVKRLCLLIVFFTLSLPSIGRAEEFVAPTLENLVKMLIRFGALDISDDNIMNSYAMVSECKLYKHFYGNDFEWHKVQAAMRKSIRQNIGSFPTAIHYDAALKLDRYDFKERIFRFTDNTSLKGIDYFTLDATGDGECGGKEEKILPEIYRFVLDQPIIMAGIPMSEEDGRKLLASMQESGNTARVIFIRFNVRVNYIARLMRKKDRWGRFTGRLNQDTDKNYVRVDARLVSIDFFEDEERTKPIYSYRP